MKLVVETVVRSAFLIIVIWGAAAYGNSCNDPCSKNNGCCVQSTTSRCSTQCSFEYWCVVKVCSAGANGPNSCSW